MNFPEFKYLEGAYSPDASNRPFLRHFTLKVGQDVTNFRLAHMHQHCYTSMFRFKDVLATTAPKWKGEVFGDFFCDCDSLKDLRDAHSFCEKYLHELASYIPLLYIRTYFSGTKGFHIEVPAGAFGATPNPKLPLYYKYISRIIAEKALDRPLKKGERLVDLGRYNQRVLWRLPNTVNLKSGLYKIPLLPREVFELSTQQIQKKAIVPRERFAFPPLAVELDAPIEKAQSLYSKAVQSHAGITWWFHKRQS